MGIFHRQVGLIVPIVLFPLTVHPASASNDLLTIRRSCLGSSLDICRHAGVRMALHNGWHWPATMSSFGIGFK
ncbi:hypothetical protein BDQ17DRAFT_1362432 [Cyathus striatus]|nr:hypothetical protein BDQ17DRAFT_1362432 [Cyathus striatus]